jgi:hypothetical protein
VSQTLKGMNVWEQEKVRKNTRITGVEGGGDGEDNNEKSRIECVKEENK